MGKRIQFKSWDCELVKRHYTNGRIALELVAWEDNPEKDIFKGEKIATCTINMPEISLSPDEVIIKDYSENEGMLRTLLDAGVVELSGNSISTSFVTCPICILASIE